MSTSSASGGARPVSVGGSYHETLQARLAKAAGKDPKKIEVNKLVTDWKASIERIDDLNRAAFPSRVALDEGLELSPDLTSENQKRLAKRAAETRNELREVLADIKYHKALAERKKSWEGKEYIPGWTWPALLTMTVRVIDVCSEIITITVLGVDTFSTELEPEVPEYAYTTMPANYTTAEPPRSSQYYSTLIMVSLATGLSMIKDLIESAGEKAAERLAELEELLEGSRKKIQMYELKLDFWRIFHRLSLENKRVTKKRGMKLLKITQQIRVVCGKDDPAYKLGVRFLTKNEISRSPSRKVQSEEDEEKEIRNSSASKKELLYRKKIKAKVKVCCCGKPKAGHLGIEEIAKINEKFVEAFAKIEEIMVRLNKDKSHSSTVSEASSRSASGSPDQSSPLKPDDPLTQIDYDSEIAHINKILTVTGAIFHKLDQHDKAGIKDASNRQCWWARVRDVIKLGVVAGAVTEVVDEAEEMNQTIQKTVFSGYIIAMIAAAMSYVNQKVTLNRLYERTEIKRMLGLRDVENQLKDLRQLMQRLRSYVQEEDELRKQQEFSKLIKVIEPTKGSVCGVNLFRIKSALAVCKEATYALAQPSESSTDSRNLFRKVIALKRQQAGVTPSPLARKSVVDKFAKAAAESNRLRSIQKHEREMQKLEKLRQMKSSSSEKKSPHRRWGKSVEMDEEACPSSDEGEEMMSMTTGATRQMVAAIVAAQSEEAGSPASLDSVVVQPRAEAVSFSGEGEGQEEVEADTRSVGDSAFFQRKPMGCAIGSRSISSDEESESAAEAASALARHQKAQSAEEKSQKSMQRILTGVDADEGGAEAADQGVRQRTHNPFVEDDFAHRTVVVQEQAIMGQQQAAVPRSEGKSVKRHMFDFFGWVKTQSGMAENRVRASDEIARQVLKTYDSHPAGERVCEHEEEDSGFDSTELSGADSSGEDWDYAGLVPEETETESDYGSGVSSEEGEE